jgi:DNA-binding response OmpR family regulator
LRAHEQERKLPVLVLSRSEHHDFEELRAYSAGADGLIHWKEAPGVLPARIEYLTGVYQHLAQTGS